MSVLGGWLKSAPFFGDDIMMIGKMSNDVSQVLSQPIFPLSPSQHLFTVSWIGTHTESWKLICAQNQVKGFWNYYWWHLLNPLEKEGGEGQSFFKRHFSAVIPAFGPSQLLGCNSSCTKGCVVSPGIPQLCYGGRGGWERQYSISSDLHLTRHILLQSVTVCVWLDL